MSTNADEFDYSSPTIPEDALFVAADEPLLVFPSATAAERYLEAIDVENGVYPAAYGPRGEPYFVHIIGNQVVIKRAAGPRRPDDLRALLLRYFEGRGRAAEPASSVEALVAEMWKIESQFWRQHDPFGDRSGTRIPLWGCFSFMLFSGAVLYLVLR